MSHGTIVIGERASALEKKAAELLADRASKRMGGSLTVVAEGESNDEALAIVGTPSSSQLINARGQLPELGEEGFLVEARPGAPAVIAAAHPQGLIFGAGLLLRASRFSDGRWDRPELSETSTPVKQLRPIYFATHFGNWYCHASIEELREYIQDLALWGYNALITWFDFHHYKDLEDGTAQWERLGRLDVLAKEVGMKVGRIAIANESFAGQAPPELTAIGRLEGTGYETDLCPSKPEARAIILDDRRQFLTRVSETTSLDWICLWPYDQGGCNCDQCTPWPKTFMELGREIAGMTKQVLPETEIMVSAWWIGTHVAGEDEAFFESLSRKETWFRTIVAGTVELRRWLSQEREIPGEYGVLLFPEVSMFDSLPWGSRGANPAPIKFSAEMAELGPHLIGAMPYSEGRYEDLNKVLWAQLQWDPSRGLSSILEDYCRDSFGWQTEEEGPQLLYDIEAGLRDLSSAAGRLELANRLEGRMEEWGLRGWRWQILKAHTLIDALKWEVDSPGTTEERRAEARAELQEVYERLQHGLYLHDEERSLRDWIYSPFDVWVTLPFNELVLPTGSG